MTYVGNNRRYDILKKQHGKVTLIVGNVLWWLKQIDTLCQCTHHPPLPANIFPRPVAYAHVSAPIPSVSSLFRERSA